MIMFTGLLARMVCNKPKSPPASLPFKALGTEHTTVKFGGSREKSHESNTRKEMRVRGAGKEITAKFVGVDKIAYKMVTKAAECRQIKFFFLEIGQSNPPFFSYTVSNRVKPL